MMMLVIVVVLLLSLLSIVLSYQRVDKITSRYTFKPLTTLLKTSTRLHGDLLIGNITTATHYID